MKRFENRVAFVTGGSRGIGKAIATSFAKEGASVFIIDINEEVLSKTINELNEQGLVVKGTVADVAKKDQVDVAVEQAIHAFEKIDILVNNAGVIRDSLLYKMTENDWDTVMNVHLKGSFNCSSAIQKTMVDNHYGRIINLSSTSALGNRGQANYSTAKAGLQGFTKTLAIELGKFGITVNAVAPGFIETDMTRATADRIGVPFETFLQYGANESPAGRVGQPEDIANVVSFYAMEESSYVSGQVIYVAGGPKD